MSSNVRLMIPILVCILLAIAPDGLAQQLSVAGTVRDATGVVPGATIVISSEGDEIASGTTDGMGAWRFDGLAPGSYQVAVSREGFEDVVRNVTLGPDTGPIDVVLAVGRVSTTLTVTATAGRATATRLPIPDDEIPAQVSSIPGELIEQQGLNTLRDALRNASGVQAFRWYGVYEQYTIRGFNDPDRDGSNVLLIDGMRFGGNRYSTQMNNVESVEVLKGPGSILYGRGAVGGSINVVRKQPQVAEAYDVSYTGGRFNAHQGAFGATGALGGPSLFYRVGASYDTTDGWRQAGADRLNIAPSITWITSERTRLTVYENFNRDRFDGDGGVPLNMTSHPDYDPSLRFSLPQDNALIRDSQTQASFAADLGPDWEFRNAFLFQKTSDRYFVTEGLYGDPGTGLVAREPLDFHHHRTPVQNQADVSGRLEGFGTHHVLFGYEFQKDDYRTDVTAGDDTGCVCGYWWMTIQPMDISTMQETQPGPLDIDTIARQTFVEDRIHAFYWQDQIDILPRLKVNVGGRFDDYDRHRERIFTSDPGNVFGVQDRNQTAYTYRAGVVYSPLEDQQVYFATSSSFSPETAVPADDSQLDPRTARNYEVGHRWQGWSGRIDTSVAYYYVIQNNLDFLQAGMTYIQVGEQRSKGVDVDVNTDLGNSMHLIVNYGYTSPEFHDADDVGLTGFVPRYVPKHSANAWLRKDFGNGLHFALGGRFVGAQFANNTNTTEIGNYTLLSGAIGFRADTWDWTLNAENLLDRERYFLPGHFSNQVFPGAPITVSNTIRLRLDRN